MLYIFRQQVLSLSLGFKNIIVKLLCKKTCPVSNFDYFKLGISTKGSLTVFYLYNDSP